jgi:hypothetical protein
MMFRHVFSISVLGIAVIAGAVPAGSDGSAKESDKKLDPARQLVFKVKGLG